MGIRIEDLSPKAQRQAARKLLEQQSRRQAAGLSRVGTEQSRPSTDVGEAKRGKYGNITALRGVMKLDSKKEARRFDELLLMEQTGQIRDLRLQQDFTLQEAYTTPDGQRIRAIRYKADFAYERPTSPDCTGTVHWIKVVEDVKSRPTRTKDYIMKRKMMQERLGITIQEV